jgi:hypothetical protein
MDKKIDVDHLLIYYILTFKHLPINLQKEQNGKEVIFVVC